ncbi:DUF389 domain-containing protein [Phaeodactylibacter luteus]|uniref:DUF389 domain-containing protein n=1 Tax=Phaeodactylibacter luteus TaxID=1564516 RepID=A0A5C6RHG9_9BACT|nr:DUF389 domain-containing protein [Phaeodactylibacter luteus]TXB61597.1 DUF389 domain-containing protein [Phaeodactylibacter luteus]
MSQTNMPARSPRALIMELFGLIKSWFHTLFDLEEGLDREGAVISIRNNRKMQGANAWLLGCSIMIASLGLDLNSPAVIIGAMLVSPLMSPILGIGLGVAINDQYTMFNSLRHFGVAILIALVTSTFYFFVTPFGNVTPEIQGRTSPTFLDGLVAIFGGLAGIISATRKDKSNAIPGVAIATALMPPLCVTGFGIAELFELLIRKGGMSSGLYAQELSRTAGIIFGSFYLFFLNSFFIALTTYLIIRFLRFPLKSYVDAREAYRNRMITAFFSMLVSLPSAFILYRLYQMQQDKQEVTRFVDEYFPEVCINYELTGIDPDTNKLILQLLGRRIPEDSIAHYEQILEEDFDLHKPVRLFPVQAEMSLNDVKSSLQAQRQEVVKMIESERRAATDAMLQAEELKLQLARSRSDSALVEKSLRLAREAFPDEIGGIQYAERTKVLGDSATLNNQHVYLVEWKNRKGTKANKERLEGILKVSTEFDTLQVISY